MTYLVQYYWIDKRTGKQRAAVSFYWIMSHSDVALYIEALRKNGFEFFLILRVRPKGGVS